MAFTPSKSEFASTSGLTASASAIFSREDGLGFLLPLSYARIDYIADRILIMKNGELIQEGTEKEITDKVEGCVWKCIVSEKEAGQITSSFIVSNMRSRGENVELRIVSERQPVAGAENVESTLEDAYLYHTQITGGEKNATL